MHERATTKAAVALFASALLHAAFVFLSLRDTARTATRAQPAAVDVEFSIADVAPGDNENISKNKAQKRNSIHDSHTQDRRAKTSARAGLTTDHDDPSHAAEVSSGLTTTGRDAPQVAAALSTAASTGGTAHGEPAAVRGAVALNAALRETSVDPSFSRRPPPHLVPLSDGTYAFSNGRINAVVDDEGNVSFPTTLAHGAARALEIYNNVTHFDVTESVIMPLAGEDPRGAEKRWFMEMTQAFRDGLARRGHANLNSHAAHLVEARLAHLANDASLTTHARHVRLVALWRDCDDEEIGPELRRVIESWVRVHEAQNSENAFSRDELTAFNRGAEPRDHFDPYAVASSL